LFDWSDFVATHNQIKQVVQTNLSALKTWIDSQITAGLADVTTFFNNIQNSVDGDFDKIIASLQGKSLGNIRAQHNDTQQIFTQGGKNYHGPCMWLHQKTRENLKAANLAVPGGPGRHRIFFPWMPNQRPGAIDDSSIDDVFTAAFEGFLDAVKTSIEQQFASLPKEMVSLGHTFSNLFANKKTFLQNALADLLGLIKTIADDLIQVGAAIARAFLLMLQSIVNALVDYVTNPPAVEIPFVSSLYKSITGQPLSWFDLVAMVIAVPSTIMFKVFESLSVVGQQVAGVPKLLDWANFFIMIVTGIVDPIADISDDFPGLAIFDFILNIYAQGVSSLLIAWPFSTWQAQDYIFWAVQWVPVIFSGYSLYLSSSQSTWAKAWREWLQTWCTFEFGVIAGIFTTILAASNWQKYGKLTLAENIVSPTIYNVIEPLKLGGETAQVVMAIIKAAMALAYAIMNLVSAITTSTPAPALLTSSPLNLKETR
jgi:hypothetical protein